MRMIGGGSCVDADETHQAGLCEQAGLAFDSVRAGAVDGAVKLCDEQAGFFCVSENGGDGGCVHGLIS